MNTFAPSNTQEAPIQETSLSTTTGLKSFTQFLAQTTDRITAQGGFSGTVERELIEQYLVAKGIQNLDAIQYDVGLARALGVSPNSYLIAQALVDQGFLSGSIPKDYDLLASSSRSFYLDPRVIGNSEILSDNQRRVVIPVLQQMGALRQDGSQDLDSLRAHRSLAKALGIEGSESTRASALARRLVDLGYFSTEVPDNQQLTFESEFSRYISAEVIPSPEQREKNLQKLITSRLRLSGVINDRGESNLDKLEVDVALACVVGVKVDERKKIAPLACALVNQGYISGELSAELSANITAGSTFYLDSEVILDPNVLRKNRRLAAISFLKAQNLYDDQNIDLDTIPADKRLARILGAESKSNQKEVICRELISLGLAQAKAPENHALTHNAFVTVYISPICIQDPLILKANRQQILTSRLINHGVLQADGSEDLDKLQKDPGLIAALGLPKRSSISQVANALIGEGLVNAEIPAGHSLGNAPYLTKYIDSEVVTDSKLRALNLHKAIRYRLQEHGAITPDDEVNLDRVRYSSGIIAALQLLGEDVRGMKALLRALVTHGIADAHLPEGHQPRKISSYFDRSVVGDIAEYNLRNYLQKNFHSISECVQSKIATTFIGSYIAKSDERACDISRKESRAFLEEKAWFAPEFRSWANPQIPDEFRSVLERKRSYVERASTRMKNSEIGSLIEHGATATFIKGEALEQVIGACLLLKYPNAQIVPQYCLNVSPPYFGTRADFMISDERGREIIEVKWGANQQNILETKLKHLGLISKRSDGPFNYKIIVLEEKIAGVVPAASLLAQDPRLELLISQIRVAAEKKDPILLAHVRDFLYSGLDDAYGQRGLARENKVFDLLSQSAEIPWQNREATLTYLAARTTSTFVPTEAFYEFKGQIHSGRITLPSLLQESPERGKLLHYFAEMKFARVEDRDLAIMLELSDEVAAELKTAARLLQQNQDEIVESASFRLRDGRTFCTQNGSAEIIIKDHEDLRSHLTFSDDKFEFGQQFIGFCA